MKTNPENIRKFTFSNQAVNFIFTVLLVNLFFISCHRVNSTQNAQPELTIYTYDSFVAEWGPAPLIAEKFEQKTGIKASFVDCGDGVQVLSRAILEKNKTQADIIIGLDNNTAKKALEADILMEYMPQNAESIISKELFEQFSNSKKIIPYDYSHFALIFNTKSNLPEPKSLSDLTNPVYKNKIILMDPRTSTPGLGFVAWTKSIFSDEVSFNNFWKDLKPNVLTMAPGWSAGYGLFVAGEAPLVISYTTSPAANLEYDKINYYKALIFPEGHAMQVEGAGILKNAPHKKEAQLFMDFLISEEAQKTLPLTQWMYPVNKNVNLPECYKTAAANPEKTVLTDNETLDSTVETVLSILK